MPRNKRTLTPGQWERLGSLLGDFLWKREGAQNIVRAYFEECGVSQKRQEILADEVWRRIEVGFARNAK